MPKATKSGKKAKEAPEKKTKTKVKTAIASTVKKDKRVTIILPVETVIALKEKGIERYLNGESNADVSSLIREAIDAFLKAQK